MTVFAVPRAEFLRALGMMGQLATALRSSITLCPLADDLLVSTAGGGVSAVCRVPIVPSGVDDGEREVLTMPAVVAGTIRAAHKPPKDRDAKAMWLMQAFRVELRRDAEITVEQIDPEGVFDADVLLSAGVGNELPVNAPRALYRRQPGTGEVEDGDLPAATPGYVAVLNAMARFYGYPVMEDVGESGPVCLTAGDAAALVYLHTAPPGEAVEQDLLRLAASAIEETLAACVEPVGLAVGGECLGGGESDEC